MSGGLIETRDENTRYFRKRNFLPFAAIQSRDFSYVFVVAVPSPVERLVSFICAIYQVLRRAASKKKNREMRGRKRDSSYSRRA